MLFYPGKLLATTESLKRLEDLEILPEDIVNQHINGDFGEFGHYREYSSSEITDISVLETLKTVTFGEFNIMAIRSNQGVVRSCYRMKNLDVQMNTYLGETNFTIISVSEEQYIQHELTSLSNKLNYLKF